MTQLVFKAQPIKKYKAGINLNNSGIEKHLTVPVAPVLHTANRAALKDDADCIMEIE